jgi:hypothetical protein
MIDKKPVEGEERYWSFITPFNEIILLKVEILRYLWDDDNEMYFYKTLIRDVLYDETGEMEKGAETFIDYHWQLQETLEEAYKLFFITIFDKGISGFTDEDAPF